MILSFLFFLFLTFLFGYKAYNQERETNLIIAGGVTLAVLATILTIISAIITIVIGLLVLFDDHLWWWF